MNEWLSQIYGTNGASDDQFQKTAQAEMLAKLAEEEGIDLSGLDEEQLQQLADTVIAQNGGGEQGQQTAVGPEVMGDEEAEKIAQAKFAEADFLGRTMAHAYVQELNEIAKTASENGGAPPFPPKKKDEEEEDKEKEKSAGPLTRAINSLGGGQQEVPEAVKLAFATLRDHGYTFK